MSNNCLIKCICCNHAINFNEQYSYEAVCCGTIYNVASGTAQKFIYKNDKTQIYQIIYNFYSNKTILRNLHTQLPIITDIAEVSGKCLFCASNDEIIDKIEKLKMLL